MSFKLEDFKLEKGATDKAKEPDPGGSDQQNLGYKKLKNLSLQYINAILVSGYSNNLLAGLWPPS